MRLFGKFVLGLGLVALLSPAALAQGGRGGFGGGGGGPAGLLSNKSVQQELKLDADQITKASKWAEEQRARFTEASQKYADLSEDERRTKMQELRRTANEESHKAVTAMLKPEQTKRFKQIVFQARGIDNLTDPEVAKALKVTDEQAEKVKALMDDQRGQTREAMQASNGDRQAAAEKFVAIRKETNAKAMALMSADQKMMYKEMAGEPFEMPAMTRPAR